LIHFYKRVLKVDQSRQIYDFILSFVLTTTMTSKVSTSSTVSIKVKSAQASQFRGRILSLVDNNQRLNSVSEDNDKTKIKQRHFSEVVTKSKNVGRSRSRSRIPKSESTKPVPNRRKSLEGLLSPGGRVRKARPTPSPRLDISDEGVLDDEDKENRTHIVPVHASKIPVPARRMSLGDLLDSPKPNLKTKRSFVIVDEPLPSLPEGVINIDIEGGLYEYAASVIVYLKQKEKEFVLSQNFLEGGSTSIAMRSMLVDWLIQVQHHLRLCQETLYLSIMMLDTVLSKRDITSEKLQLVGVTCLLIASKLEEYYPADISKLIHLTSNSYTGRQVIKMELVIMDILGCQLYMPEIMSFLRRYVRATFRSQDTKYLKTCQYLIDVTIPEKGFSAIAPSTQAAASILAANLLFFLNSNKVIPSEDEMWSKTLIYYTGLSILDVVYTARTMIRCLREMKWDGPKMKYQSNSAHQRVALSTHVHESILLGAEDWLTDLIES